MECSFRHFSLHLKRCLDGSVTSWLSKLVQNVIEFMSMMLFAQDCAKQRKGTTTMVQKQVATLAVAATLLLAGACLFDVCL